MSDREDRKAEWLQQFWAYKKGKRKRRDCKVIEQRADGVCVCVWVWECVKRWEWRRRREKVRRPVQAGLMANTDISGRPACVFFSLAKGGLHSPFSFFLSSLSSLLSLSIAFYFFIRLLSGSESGSLSLSVSLSLSLSLICFLVHLANMSCGKTTNK